MCASRSSADLLARWLSLLWLANWSSAGMQPVAVDFNSKFQPSFDGTWSTAQIRVGRPQQWLQLLPSTVSAETWVIGTAGCDGTVTCIEKRGNVFDASQSSTWADLGLFQVGLSSLATTQTVAQYGLDNVAVSAAVSVPNQSIAIITDVVPWLGQLGLSIESSQFNDTIEHLSYISTLIQKNDTIPSYSYGYTAGAYYKEKSVIGSLTLGGLDSTRYVPNDVTFTLSKYTPKVAVSGISVTSSGSSALPPNWVSNPLKLMDADSAALFTIDSSTPFMWLPSKVCDNMASALNLTYNSDLDLYTYTNETNPSRLAAWDLSFSFTFADSVSSTTTIELPISYDAFNMQLSYPFPGFSGTAQSASLNYFPLRRANSSSQYILGRTLLQEIYLAVDYERSSFSLAQAVFPDTDVISPNLVAISRPAVPTLPGPARPASGLSAGAKAGLGVGVTLGVLLMLGAVVLFFRRRTSKHSTNSSGATRSRRSFLAAFRRVSSSGGMTSELIGDKYQPTEVSGADARHELGSKIDTSHELAGKIPVEMSAGEVSATFLAQNQAKVSTPARNQGEPAELEPRVLNEKAALNTRLPPSDVPAPAYSPTETTQQNNSHSSVSPFTSQNGETWFNGSHSSHGQSISPVVSPRINTQDIIIMDRLDSPLPSTLESETNDSTSRIMQAIRDVQGSDEGHQLDSSSHVPRSASRVSRTQEDVEVDGTLPSEVPSTGQSLRARYSWEV